ncbi:ParB/RepB/Spo0J family partition protein [Streptomyces anthocyanicus]|uniref:ParB/RepB/Spo0J family partition protein n=1 Tax=Streptomyces anthocyanicus TaxID=68174 RepID=UPI002F912CC8|nr:ParB/RepB/Spo0J family partition protein [Streptomyces anthocyanicus]
MSKADQLGAGRFAGSARPVSARRAAIGAATGVPTEGVAPPTRLPISRISPNPDNPRTTLGDLTELAGSLQEHGQKQAITVMNRDAYVKANPERVRDLEPDTTHVVVDGSSRLAAAREAGLTHLNVMVDDDQGSDADAILESALVANIHRSDLDPLDEAHALQRLLALHGSQVKLAKRLRKSQGWVSQRLALLNLAPQLQAVIGEEPVELLRSVAKEPQDRQAAALAELKAARARREAERRAPDEALSPTPEPVVPAPEAADTRAESVDTPRVVVDTPAIEAPPVSEADPAGSAAPPSRVEKQRRPKVPEKAVTPPEADTGEAADGSVSDRTVEPVETVPEPRSDQTVVSPDPAEAGSALPRRLPYDDGAYIAMHLIHKMSDVQIDRMLEILIRHQRDRLESRTSSH